MAPVGRRRADRLRMLRSGAPAKEHSWRDLWRPHTRRIFRSRNSRESSRISGAAARQRCQQLHGMVAAATLNSERPAIDEPPRDHIHEVAVARQRHQNIELDRYERLQRRERPHVCPLGRFPHWRGREVRIARKYAVELRGKIQCWIGLVGMGSRPPAANPYIPDAKGARSASRASALSSLLGAF